MPFDVLNIKEYKQRFSKTAGDNFGSLSIITNSSNIIFIKQKKYYIFLELMNEELLHGIFFKKAKKINM